MVLVFASSSSSSSFLVTDGILQYVILDMGNNMHLSSMLISYKGCKAYQLLSLIILLNTFMASFNQWQLVSFNGFDLSITFIRPSICLPVCLLVVYLFNFWFYKLLPKAIKKLILLFLFPDRGNLFGTTPWYLPICRSKVQPCTFQREKLRGA